jgi:Contact-dependent growth inhibition CdiA C-terminal domain
VEKDKAKHDGVARAARGERDAQRTARPAPGKVTRTSKLPGTHGPVQRQPRGGMAPPARGSAAGSVGRPASDDGPVEDWTLVAVRPDLHQTPILRQSRSEIGLAHVSLPESMPGMGELPDDVQAQQVTTGHAFAPRSAAAAVQRQRAPAEHEPSVTIEDVLRHLDEERWDVDTLTARLTDAQMRTLSAGDRMRLIDYVSGGHRVDNEDEQTLVRLLATTPAGQAAGVRGRLGTAFLRQLDAAIDFDEYRDYHSALRSLFFDSLSPGQAAEQMANARVFPWADPGLIHALWNVRFYYEEVELHDDGKLHVRYWTNLAALGTRAEAVALDPFEMIAVRFLYPEQYAGAERDQTIYMPAINLRSLHRKQFRDELQTAVDVGLVAAGGVGLVAAGSRLARAVATLDLAMGAADLVIRDFRQQIASSQEGQDFLAAWDIVSTLVAVYGIARVAIEAPRAIQRLRQAWQRLRGTGATRDMGNLGEQVDGMLDGAGEVEEVARQSARGDAAVADGGNAGARGSSAPDASTTSAGKPTAGSVNAAPMTVPSQKPDPDAMPGGKKTRISPNERPDSVRALGRENESAEVLAKNGYEVEQNPAIPGTGKKPDYRVEGQIFDNYAPTTDSPRNIWKEVQRKVIAGQTKRIIVNLHDSKVDLPTLTKQFADWPISDLEQVLVIHGRQVTQIWP